MILTKEHVGKRVRISGWPANNYFELVALREDYAIGFDDRGVGMAFYVYDKRDWELYVEPQKMVRKAPAIIQASGFTFCTDRLFSSEEETRKFAKNIDSQFVKWPANDSMWCEVPE